MLGNVGSSGIMGQPGIPGDKYFVPCCGIPVSYDINIGWFCNKCTKKYHLTLDLVSYNEYKNIKRTELIDKALDVSN